MTYCEEIHNNLSKLNCRSHIGENCIVAMVRGPRQALTRIGCLQASHLDLQWNNLVLQKWPITITCNVQRQRDRCIVSV